MLEPCACTSRTVRHRSLFLFIHDLCLQGSCSKCRITVQAKLPLHYKCHPSVAQLPESAPQLCLHCHRGCGMRVLWTSKRSNGLCCYGGLCSLPGHTGGDVLSPQILVSAQQPSHFPSAKLCVQWQHESAYKMAPKPQFTRGPNIK